MSSRVILTLFFLITIFRFGYSNTKEVEDKKGSEERGLIPTLENKVLEYSELITKWFDNNYLASTEIGKMLGYNKVGTNSTERGRSKKMSMAMMPLIFHMGAASSWMLLTALMAAKSVAIGMLLLIMKIAVSSAKLAGFFTAWKVKHHGHHHDWSPPHFDHGHDRSFSEIDYAASSQYHVEENKVTDASAGCPECKWHLPKADKEPSTPMIDPRQDWSSHEEEWAPHSDHHSPPHPHHEYQTIPINEHEHSVYPPYHTESRRKDNHLTQGSN